MSTVRGDRVAPTTAQITQNTVTSWAAASPTDRPRGDGWQHSGDDEVVGLQG
ncbi:MAG TPA: hypothetical protein VFV01_25845 [Spirillospora sp.]|nr:hypothetical protein [Spirillospora sp.]